MATTVNLSLDQGSIFSYAFELGEDSDVSLANSVAFAAMKTEYDSNSSVSFVTDINGSNVVITMTSSVTSNLASGTWVYDVITVDGSNSVTRISQGRIRVSPAVTRPTP